MKTFVYFALVVSLYASPLRVADWRAFPGARKSGECMRYSAAVQSALAEKHLIAHEVRYHWRGKRGNTGAHSVVLFRYAGEWFIVDNERTDPVKVSHCAGGDNQFTAAGMLKAMKFFSNNTATNIYYVN